MCPFSAGSRPGSRCVNVDPLAASCGILRSRKVTDVISRQRGSEQMAFSASGIVAAGPPEAWFTGARISVVRQDQGPAPGNPRAGTPIVGASAETGATLISGSPEGRGCACATVRDYSTLTTTYSSYSTVVHPQIVSLRGLRLADLHHDGPVRARNQGPRIDLVGPYWRRSENA
jgi:hypothetical protein